MMKIGETFWHYGASMYFSEKIEEKEDLFTLIVLDIESSKISIKINTDLNFSEMFGSFIESIQIFFEEYFGEISSNIQIRTKNNHFKGSSKCFFCGLSLNLYNQFTFCETCSSKL